MIEVKTMKNRIDLKLRTKRAITKSNEHYLKLGDVRRNENYPTYIDENSRLIEIKFVVRANFASCWGPDIVDFKQETSKLKDPLRIFITNLLKKEPKATDSVIETLVYTAYGLLNKGPTEKDSDLDYYGTWIKAQTFSLNIDHLVEIMENYLNRENDI